MLNQSDIEDLQFVMLSLSAGSMTPEGNVSVDGRTISWKYTSSSTNKMEVSVSSKRMRYWSGWEWDSNVMRLSWIGTGFPITGGVTLSTSQTSYARTDGRWQLASMKSERGIPIGGVLKYLHTETDGENN